MASYTPDPRGYELMVLLSPELGEEALEAQLERVSDGLNDAGAEITSVKKSTPWGRRRLAYPIQKHQDAFYVLYTLSSQPGALDSFERDLKINTNVLRYLLIRQEKTEVSEEEEAEAEAESATDEATDDAEPTEEDSSDTEESTGDADAAETTAEADESETAEAGDDERA